MNRKVQILSALLASVLIFGTGCATTRNNSSDGTTDLETNAPEADPREAYIADGEEYDKLFALFSEKFPSDFPETADDRSEHELFCGFHAHFAVTPTVGEPQNTTIVQVYSEEGLHKYFHENAETYDLSELSLSAHYDDSFFDDKALLIVALSDSDGASGYELVGGWQDRLVGEGYELDELVFAVKKTSGDATASHAIIELDKKFIALWDSFFVNIFE